ncbi:MAG: iron-containing alcohol dehydrogenase [Dehalococcoidia bacterium]
MGITRFYLPTRFIIGAGSLSQLGKEACRLGKTALLVTGSKSMRKTGVLDRVINDLNGNDVKPVVFDEVEPNPRASTIDRGADKARQNNAQLVIGLGGGSVMDASKCIALAAGGTEPIFSIYEGRAKAGKALPILLIPTVAASGSEANAGAVVTNWDTHEKVVIGNSQMNPTLSIIDPELTLTLPARPTAQGGLDIFCHLVEPYITCDEFTLINDSLREACMRTVVETLPAVLAKLDDIEGRTRLSWASTIACSQFASLGGGTGLMTLHAIEHALSGHYDIAHADGLAALLIEWMKYTSPVREDRFKRLGKNVFGASDGIEATRKWLKRVGMDFKLSSLHVKDPDFEKLAATALKTGSWAKFHPRTMDATAIASIYKKSF